MRRSLALTSGALTQLTDLLWQQSTTRPAAVDPDLRALPVELGAPFKERYLAVPSHRAPRYLLPLDADRAARRRLLSAYNGLRSPRRRVMRRLVAEASARGLLPEHRRNLVEVEPSLPCEESLRKIASRALGMRTDELIFAIGVNDKGGLVRPTLTVADRSGNPLLFVKIARHPALRRRLRSERDALADVQERPVAGIVTPAPVLFTEWAGRSVLGVSPLPLEAKGFHFRDFTEAHDFLGTLQASRPETHEVLRESTWGRALLERIELLTAPWRSELRELFEEFLSEHGQSVVAVGIRHGDWSPWNMAHLPGRHIAVWDWEFSEQLAPLSLDQLNWEFAYATSVRRIPTAKAARGLLAQGHDVVATQLFLLDMTVRRAEEATCGLVSSADASIVLQQIIRESGLSSRP